MVHFDIKVTGKVQGVYYRINTRKKAYECGLTGYVRNEHDGSVSIEAEGTLENLNEFVDWCKTGPEGARVDEVIVSSGEMRNYKSFEITG